MRKSGGGDDDDVYEPRNHQDLDLGRSDLMERIDAYFKVSARGSTIWTEVRAGLVTFVTMAYILMVNPEVLTHSGTNHTGGSMPFGCIVTATALSSAIASLTVGLTGNLPFGLAPGMGLNSYFTYGVVLRMGLTWQIALATVFFQGILFMILSLSGACSMIQQFAPPCIKKSITVGLGLFQALIGFDCIKLVVQGQGVLLTLGDMSRPDVWLALFGVLIISVLLVLEVKAAMLAGILFVTLTAWATGLSPSPEGILQLPELSGTLGQLDIPGFFRNFSKTLPVTLVFLFVSIFDTAGVQFAAGTQAGLIGADHKLPSSKQAFFSAGLATTLGSVLGTSPVIIHNETCAGIQDGGRTGLTAVTVAACFMIALPFAPVFKAVPIIATAPPLIVVGMFMMAHAKFIDWEDLDEGMPAFVVVCLLPFTYSIANGMVFGLATWVLIKSITTAARFVTGHEIASPVITAEGIKDPQPGVPRSPFISPSKAHRRLNHPSSRAAVNQRQAAEATALMDGDTELDQEEIEGGDISDGQGEMNLVSPHKLDQVRQFPRAATTGSALRGSQKQQQQYGAL